MHYYKFNISDWALHTSHLSLEEEAIYFRLINHYYDTEKLIPLETQSVLRRLRLANHSDIVGLMLNEFFVKTESGYIHSRCEIEIKEYHKKANSNKNNGMLGGRPKKINNLDNNPEITQMVSENNPNITLTNNYKPITNNKEPITINHKPTTINHEIEPLEVLSDSVKAKKTTQKNKPDFFASCNPQLVSDYYEVRKAKRAAKVTETVYNAFVREAGLAGITVDDALRVCVERNWVGFKADWYKNAPAGGGFNKQAAIAENNRIEALKFLMGDNHD